MLKGRPGFWTIHLCSFRAPSWNSSKSATCRTAGGPLHVAAHVDANGPLSYYGIADSATYQSARAAGTALRIAAISAPPFPPSPMAHEARGLRRVAVRATVRTPIARFNAAWNVGLVCAQAAGTQTGRCVIPAAYARLTMRRSHRCLVQSKIR